MFSPFRFPVVPVILTRNFLFFRQEVLARKKRGKPRRYEGHEEEGHSFLFFLRGLRIFVVSPLLFWLRLRRAVLPVVNSLHSIANRSNLVMRD